MSGDGFDVEDSRVFWTTAAQIAGVFAIPLVIEARRSVARWRKTPKVVRRAQGIYYFVAGYIILQTVTLALQRLLQPKPGLTEPWLAIIGITFLCFGLVGIPVTNYFATANADWAIFMARVAPWSAWRRERRGNRADERAFVETVRGLFDSWNVLANQLAELQGHLPDAKIRDAAILAMKAKGFDFEKLLHEVPIEKVVPNGSKEATDLAKTMILEASVERNVRQGIARTKKAIRSLDKAFLSAADLSGLYDAVRVKERITHLSEELKSAIEQNVLDVADDARDDQVRETALATFESRVRDAKLEASNALAQGGAHPPPTQTE